MERHPEANRHQRTRRAKNPRIDYYPSQEALAVIDSRRARRHPLNTNSGVIDAIIAQWAELSGINNREEIHVMTSARRPELTDANARANDSGGALARMQAPENRTKQARVQCGAKTKAGHPCGAKSIPGKRRCKWHGGCSTGPRTDEGRMRSRANLRQFRVEACAESTP